MRATLPKVRSGFTLAELLTVLTVLSIIATFSIPKIITSTKLSINKAKMREVVSYMQDLYWNGAQSGEWMATDRNINNANSTFSQWIKSKISYDRFCAPGETDGECMRSWPGYNGNIAMIIKGVKIEFTTDYAITVECDMSTPPAILLPPELDYAYFEIATPGRTTMNGKPVVFGQLYAGEACCPAEFKAIYDYIFAR